MYGNDVRRTAIFGQYGTAVRTVRNCSENTNVYGVRPFTSTKPEILTMNKNVLRKNIYVQTKAILKISDLTLSPRDLHLFKGNFDPLLHMFPKVLGS